MNLLLIPTIEPLHFGENCVSSFQSSLTQTSTVVVVVYNGQCTDVKSHFTQPNVIRIGCEDSRNLVEAFSEIADCPERLLFGEQRYNRSYGGASNLLLVIGYALGASVIGKVDDDCLQPDCAGRLWLSSAIKHVAPQRICHGPYSGNPSGFLRYLPEKTALHFIEYVYSKKASKQPSLIGTGQEGKSIKNGNLVIPREALPLSCYPVLYDPHTDVHARGEVYYWMRELAQQGYETSYKESLVLEHRLSDRNTVDTWLRSIVLAFDLSFVYRVHISTGRHPELSVRRQALLQFKSWIMSASWPTVDISKTLVDLLDNASLDFTEKFYADLPKRKVAWKRLLTSDLSSAVWRCLPALMEKALQASHQRKTGRKLRYPLASV